MAVFVCLFDTKNCRGKTAIQIQFLKLILARGRSHHPSAVRHRSQSAADAVATANDGHDATGRSVTAADLWRKQ